MLENLQGFETWFFGGLISLMLAIIVFFLRNGWTELREIIQRHEEDIRELKEIQSIDHHRLGIVEESTKKGQESFEQIMTKLGAMGSREKR